ncbi:uncharacterized protein LOC133733691 [Rosa rugosa]|uniref:uncharacterized protein LOC133733691 n=1 Tax=Rosa rugosa TaxID=74645 RepID=UPI002B40DFA1|nr:uncharacterized protein LOC133733691 [Rosa rugosa]
MMDSALFLHRGALNIPSTTSRAAGLARPYSSFRPSSLSLFSRASTYPTLSRHTFNSPVICALNKQPSPPSPNYDKDNGKKIVMVGGASEVLACAPGVINYNFNFSPTAIACKNNSSSSSTEEDPQVVLPAPKKVLDSFLKLNRHITTPKSGYTPQLSIFDSFPDMPREHDYDNLEIAVADLIKSGMCSEAERQLINLYNKTSKKKGPHQAKDVEMELVLVLIFQGKYKEASERGCLKCEPMNSSKGLVHFYKAIIYTMLGDQDDRAKKHWDIFLLSFNSPN